MYQVGGEIFYGASRTNISIANPLNGAEEYQQPE
jgi:hypothetical protein